MKPDTSAERPPLQDPRVYERCRTRLGLLRADSRPRWGQMSVGQMLAHCAEAQEVFNGKPLEGTPWYVRLLAPVVKRGVVGGRPYPRGVMTHPQYRVTEEREFEKEKARLERALDAFLARDDAGHGVVHPIFGRLTEEEAGWAAYKHLDHHLEQFGV